MQRRQAQLADRRLAAAPDRRPAAARHRRTPRWCWRARTRGSPAAPRRTERPARRAARRAARSPTRARARRSRKENRSDTATACDPGRADRRRPAPRTSSSASGVTTSPWASMRSVTSKRQRRGTSTAGPSWNRSYRSARAERRSSSRSRMPRVVTKAVRAPLPSSSALVTTVVAWDSSVTSAGRTPLRRGPWRARRARPGRSRAAWSGPWRRRCGRCLLDHHHIGEGAADVDPIRQLMVPFSPSPSAAAA